MAAPLAAAPVAAAAAPVAAKAPAAAGAGKAIGSKLGGLAKQQAIGTGMDLARGDGSGLKKTIIALFGLVGVLLFPLLFAVMGVVIFFQGLFNPPDISKTFRPLGSGVPAGYWQIYEVAASHFKVNPFLLASIHMQETAFSTNPTTPAGFNSNGCCAGPMQFNVKDGTWDGHKDAVRAIESERPEGSYPLDRRAPGQCKSGGGHVPCAFESCAAVPKDTGCVYDDFDAIAAAAHKLKEDGADESLESRGTYQAVCAYIGACSELANCGGPNAYCQVLPRAREWNRQGEAAIETVGDVGIPLEATKPRTIERVVAVANAIAKKKLPYCWGGGHVAKPGPSHGTSYCVEGDTRVAGNKHIGLDCSGSVRWLLVLSGFPDPGGIASGEFGGYLKSGRGERLTVYYSGTHVWADINGREWGTSSSHPERNHGPGWNGPASANGFTAGHVNLLRGPREPQRGPA